jgi:hypothetical protein
LTHSLEITPPLGGSPIATILQFSRARRRPLRPR